MRPKDFARITGRLREAANATAGIPAGQLRSLSTYIDALARGDLAPLLAAASADVTLQIFAPPEFPFVRESTGLDAIKAAIEQNFDSVLNQQPEISDVFGEGDSIVLFGRERGVIRATRMPYDVEFVQKFTFAGEKLTAVRIVVAHRTSVAP